MSCGECESTELMPSKQPDPADVAQSSPRFSLDPALTPPTLLEMAILRQQSKRIAAMHSWGRANRFYSASLVGILDRLLACLGEETNREYTSESIPREGRSNSN